jgi:shikimate kinase
MPESEQASPSPSVNTDPTQRAGADLLDRPVVMVGLMGAGKTSIGRRLAAQLSLPFVDADAEIEAAAGCTIAEIFERHGEAAFRDGERRVIARLLEGPPQVIATGGGAYMDAATRALVTERAIALWLRADLDTLTARTSRRSNRPLLKDGNPRATLDRLMQERYPVYAEADIVVDSQDCPPDETTQAVLKALLDYLERQQDTAVNAAGTLP